MLLCKEFSCTYMYFFMTDLRIPQTWLLKMTHLLFHTSKCQKSKISITESKSRCSQSLTPFKAPRGKSISFFFFGNLFPDLFPDSRAAFLGSWPLSLSSKLVV